MLLSDAGTTNNTGWYKGWIDGYLGELQPE